MPDRYAAFLSYAHRYQPWVLALQRNVEAPHAARRGTVRHDPDARRARRCGALPELDRLRDTIERVSRVFQAQRAVVL